MKIAFKPLAAAVVLLFAADPIVWAQSASAPKSPPDITGRWVLELSGQYGNCAGPIDISPRGDPAGAGWAAIYAITCDGDTEPGQQRFQIRANAAGSYHFAGSGEHPDIFDLNWTQDGKALAGSGSFANQPLAAAMHK
ncbi:MAG: hypothetical protein ACLPL5_12170 [Stellaceae bacterium]|jgi:hypothetical protein